MILTFGEHTHTSLPKIKTDRANSALVKEELNSDNVTTVERSLGSAVVKTSHGPIEGIKLKTSRAGNTVTAYLGVPYARQEQMTHDCSYSLEALTLLYVRLNDWAILFLHISKMYRLKTRTDVYISIN